MKTLFKYFIFCIFCNSISFDVCAGDIIKAYGNIHVKDTANMSIVYVHVAIDPVTEQRKVKYELLSFGNNLILYGGYGDYQMDSLYMENPDLRDLPLEERMNLRRKFEPITNHMLTDRESGDLYFYGHIPINYYRYTEPIPKIGWILSEETEEIMGHECHKATTKWRGREWTAWYSDIPIDAGPWKFQGLPGIILKLEDSTGQHYFEAIGTKNDSYPIGYHDHLYSRSTREKFNALLKHASEHWGSDMVDSGMIIPQSEEEEQMLRSRRRFYSPIELE